jgi:hypothetical protein
MMSAEEASGPSQAPENSVLRTGSGFLYLWQQDRISGLTAWLALFTGLLAVETGLSAWILKNTDEGVHNTLVSGNRGWIFVERVELLQAESLAIGRPIDFSIFIKHRGNEPANSTRVRAETKKLFRGSENDSWWQDQPELKPLDCKGESYGKPFHLMANGYEQAVEYKTGSIYDDRMDEGKQTLYVNGCIHYVTLAKPHVTEFCYYLHTNPGEIATLSVRRCPYGNRAD